MGPASDGRGRGSVEGQICGGETEMSKKERELFGSDVDGGFELLLEFGPRARVAGTRLKWLSFFFGLASRSPRASR